MGVDRSGSKNTLLTGQLLIFGAPDAHSHPEAHRRPSPLAATAKTKLAYVKKNMRNKNICRT